MDESYDPHARMHESFPRADSGTKMAGDVIPIPGEKSMGPGPTPDAVPYALGQSNDNKVKSIGMDTVKSWYERRR
jgi:hypothetical protein